MEKILISMCDNNDYILDENTLKVIRDFLEDSVFKKDGNFANGRLVRNLYDDLVMNHARRIINIEHPTRADLATIINYDFKSLLWVYTMW